jgi:Ribbon-helix-helix protein, copG family
MEKMQVYLRKDELDALRKAAARSGRSVSELVRDTIRKVVLQPQAAGPVAIWDGKPRCSSTIASTTIREGRQVTGIPAKAVDLPPGLEPGSQGPEPSFLPLDDGRAAQVRTGAVARGAQTGVVPLAGFEPALFAS